MKITSLPIHFLAVISFLLCGSLVNAQEHSVAEANNEGPVNTQQEITDYTNHHLKDSHDFHLFSYQGSDGERHSVGFSLPIILWASNGPVAFMSSEFHHDIDGEVVVEKGGSRFVNLHDKIYELEEGADSIVMGEDQHPENAHKPFDLSITKSVFGILLVGLLLLFWFGSLGKQYKKKKIPTGFGRALEPLVIYVRDEIARPNIGEHKYKKYMSFLLTVFFFIWVSNLLGMTPFGFNITGQIAVTVCLALFTFFIVQFSGNKDYWKHIFWMPDVPVIMKIILIPIEVLGMLTKPFSLLIRLFANITAGHVVVMGLVALMITLKAQFGAVGSTGLSLVLTLFISVIEILVAFLQAFIFTMLSALFIGMAVAEHDHHHEHDTDDHEVDDVEDVRESFV
ncbi:F0F1 ATP synthase subunit A [Leeuwenhoekiella marinoflava]|uniref:ATP synthase subunit a n=2 Tax=Leeuwenhoekiella marinoflava TaxID=988 RepID=A0A4Q0PSJ9_9FLAO|nr:F0F1 ATP synthase subunit A [Leeuwenhoekiella marinoflava]RXG32935.1 ATP synthase F0 subcomplex A subunit [Leeuwenhoekiella marinoflava]SHE32537.1 ATP synthase F0 subcomplex A subunit [Leeuwenhoekiella marinoflava DSM 3653]